MTILFRTDILIMYFYFYFFLIIIIIIEAVKGTQNLKLLGLHRLEIKKFLENFIFAATRNKLSCSHSKNQSKLDVCIFNENKDLYSVHNTYPFFSTGEKP